MCNRIFWSIILHIRYKNINEVSSSSLIADPYWTVSINLFRIRSDSTTSLVCLWMIRIINAYTYIPLLSSFNLAQKIYTVMGLLIRYTANSTHSCSQILIIPSENSNQRPLHIVTQLPYVTYIYTGISVKLIIWITFIHYVSTTNSA